MDLKSFFDSKRVSRKNELNSIKILIEISNELKKFHFLNNVSFKNTFYFIDRKKYKYFNIRNISNYNILEYISYFFNQIFLEELFF